MAESLLNSEEQQLSASPDGSNQKGRLKKIIGIVLSIIMVILTIYVLSLQNQNYHTMTSTNALFSDSSSAQATNYRSYVQQYKETKLELEETTRKLEAVQKELDEATAELNTTKGLLSQTQVMLAQAQNDNTKLKAEIQELDTLRTTESVNNVPELEAKIGMLKKDNGQLSNELSGMKQELKAFQADFNSMDEGRSLISLFQNKIRLVSSRMRNLKQQAYFAKIAAQKEKDRIETLNGNSGYLMKDGQLQKTTNSKSYAIDVKIVQ